MEQKVAKIYFVFSTMGTEKSFQYWERPLDYLVAKYTDLRVYTLQKKEASPPFHHPIDSKIFRLHFNKKSYAKGFFVINIFSLVKILRQKPDLLVINECHILSFLMSFLNVFFKVKTLLFIESSHLNHRRHKLMFLKRWMYLFIMNRATKILTNNQKGFDFLTQYMQITDDKIKTTPFLTSTIENLEGSEVKDLSTLSQKEKGVYLKILYVGQIVYRKGIVELIDALAKMKSDLLGKVRFTLIGTGAEFKLIKDKIKKGKLERYVDLKGPVPFRELGTYYRDAHVFVMPTLEDYRALVGFEAISYGLGMLHSVFDGAVDEVTRDSYNGYQYDPLKEGDFEEKLTLLLENYNPSIHQHSLQIAKTYSAQKIMENLDQEIQLLLG